MNTTEASPGIPPRPRRTILVWMAEGFGLGRIPFAPGTWGTLPGLVIVIAAWHGIPPEHWSAQLMLSVVCAALAVPICSIGEKFYGSKDPHPVVADEYLCFPLCMVGLPATPALLAFGFLTFRLMDILKPWPAYRIQRLKGGLGITMDDFFAALWALALNHLAYYFLPGWF